jgi:hypothetical protein
VVLTDISGVSTNGAMIDLVERLDRDVIRATTRLTPQEMRYLVDTYYQIQKVRIQFGNANYAATESEEPSEFPAWLGRQFHKLETRLKSVMKAWASERDAGIWAMKQVGIGPVLAAGLLAHIDPEKAHTAGAVWRFAGLDPTLEWNKGEKRPYNAKLKVLCFKIGDSFVKFHNHENCYYGHLYAQRKAQEIERNDAGLFREQAEATMEKKRITEPETKAWYDRGLLPPGRIEFRARRYAVKLFLAHFQQVLRESHNLEVPNPYAIEHLGHVHLLTPPGWPLAAESE